jgi:hypothetical protein
MHSMPRKGKLFSAPLPGMLYMHCGFALNAFEPGGEGVVAHEFHQC